MLSCNAVVLLSLSHIAHKCSLLFPLEGFSNKKNRHSSAVFVGKCTGLFYTSTYSLLFSEAST